MHHSFKVFTLRAKKKIFAYFAQKHDDAMCAVLAFLVNVVLKFIRKFVCLFEFT